MDSKRALVNILEACLAQETLSINCAFTFGCLRCIFAIAAILKKQELVACARVIEGLKTNRLGICVLAY